MSGEVPRGGIPGGGIPGGEISGAEPHWVDIAISRLLRGGVTISIGIVLCGVLITFLHHPSYISSRPALRQLTGPEAVFPHTIPAVFHQAAEEKGQAIVMIGLLLLIATPVARVAFSIAVFALQHDRLYVGITTTVLILLIISFAFGAAG
jgi:uncharacterized membrane protein